ncbi:sorcin-like [Dermacentor silvarum]|uniref:sorcin-like n=1 Tax=Dermacentor silvarum TaxID=543639 RepID=UPI0018995356|nr:sorcin-like [Dermacentor silvarum]XP_037572253.1 sorcin-like [Dermacentor silvarum]
MDALQMYKSLSQLNEWPTQRPISRLTAKFVLDYVLTSGISDDVELVSLAYRAIECWASVFQHFDPEDHGWISSDVFHEALSASGYNVSKYYVRCLLRASERLGQVSFDNFVKACATTAKVHP